jgi:hypothetical protein
MNNIKSIFDEAMQKFQSGEKKYGVYDPCTDQHDFLTETEAEILDAINYIAMFLMKIWAQREKSHGNRKHEQLFAYYPRQLNKVSYP